MRVGRGGSSPGHRRSGAWGGGVKEAVFPGDPLGNVR